MDLNVQYRENTGKSFNRRLRKQGIIPGVVYGKGEPTLVSMDTKYVSAFIQSFKGSTKVLRLNVESLDKSEQKQVIIQDYQVSNLGNKLLHIDFFEVSDDSVITLEVPIKIINEDICPAVKAGVVLQVIRRTLPIRCMAKDIPENILVDVQDIEFGSNIHVLDLEYDDGVAPVVTARNFTVLTASGRIMEEEEETEETTEEDVIEEGAEEGEGSGESD